MRHLSLFVAVGLFVVSSFAFPALSHMGAKGVVKERMDAMSAMGKTMKALNAMARGKVPYDGKTVAAAGRLMKGHAEKIPALFPKGPVKPPSDAKPEIWTDWAGFKKRADDLAQEAARLATVGNTKALSQQFRRVGKTCSACHKTFRAKKRKR